MKTLVPFVKRAIPKKYTKFGPKLELVLIIRTKMRPACTTKNFEKSIIWNLIKQSSSGVFIPRRRVGSLFMRKQAVEKASLQKRKGADA